jgi:hypothetical protein
MAASRPLAAMSISPATMAGMMSMPLANMRSSTFKPHFGPISFR